MIARVDGCVEAVPVSDVDHVRVHGSQPTVGAAGDGPRPVVLCAFVDPVRVPVVDGDGTDGIIFDRPPGGGRGFLARAEIRETMRRRSFFERRISSRRSAGIW